MNVPLNKKKSSPTQNKVLKKKSARNVNKKKVLKKPPKDELFELTQTWDDDLCE